VPDDDAAEGTYVSVAGVPASRLPPAGAAFRRAFGAKVSFYAPLAAQATDVLLDAIAASDGTRTSVLKRLFALRIRHGIVGDIRFDQNGDLVTGPVTILRMQRGAPNELGTAGGAGAVVARIITPPPSIVP
jgi:ABC-type branched-subunit amino acid transport system substrate-binding protein